MNINPPEDLSAFRPHVDLINRFVEIVERKAEEKMRTTGRFEGAHYAAMMELQRAIILSKATPIKPTSTTSTPVELPITASFAPEPFVRIKAVAKHLGVSLRTVHNRMYAGLPHYAPSQRLKLFKLSDVDAWMARQFRRG